MDQLTVFEQPVARARRTDPVTSHRAAASVTRIRASQFAVLRCFYECGPMHDERMLTAYQGPPQSESGLRTRRHELEVRGLLQDSGKTATTRSGRQTVIWELTPAGRSEAAL